MSELSKTQQKTSSNKTSLSEKPSITLPKGGGAIQGIGEKFAANPVTGTGSLSVPIALSPGRSDFSPQLALSYDSGAGNGPFGFGWHLSLPSITRKTDKGLPRYHDAENSDMFILSGAEDLVPVFKKDPDGNWAKDPQGNRIYAEESRNGYFIKRYRPRIEGLFARIERWTHTKTGETHWRSISRDNITTLYGKTEESRIADITDPSRVFSWLICESYDDKGNAIIYTYQPEDSAGIDFSKAHEKNRTRTAQGLMANRYLKSILYGNQTSRLVQPDLTEQVWLFEAVFDYDEGHSQALPSEPQEREFIHAVKDKSHAWTLRLDPFSSYRAGFEVRTQRLCHRILMFHHFPNELGTDDCLVRSTEFTYQQTSIASFMTQVTQAGYNRQENGSYLKKSLPPLAFEYSEAHIQSEIQEIDRDSLANLPIGLDGSQYQWLDLDGEGLPGILTEQANAWFYKANLGDGCFGPLEAVAQKPSLAALHAGNQQLLDLAGDGQLDLVLLDAPTPGFYERTTDQRWEQLKSFTLLPNINWNDPNLRFVDLTGDGHADILITEDRALVWYSSLAEQGFQPGEKIVQALDEEKGPRLIFADGTQSIYLADMSGDGLTDLIRINNGEICYWPNLGYGHFGGKVTMENLPRFDCASNLFQQRRIRLADIDGSGTTDLIYLAPEGIDVYRNQAGNSWSDAERLANFPCLDDLSSVMAVDLLGNGTACLIWSSPLPVASRKPMRYIDLMGGQKPHLLIKTVNNLGAETQVHYTSSTKFYLADKKAGKPWITPLPFPVHVVEKVVTYDRISRNRFVTRYAYHHGYFDGIEREFRGFGMVEQWDTETLGVFALDDTSSEDITNWDGASFVPPVYTKNWFHTGVYLGREHVSNFFAGLLAEHDRGDYYREPSWNDEEASKHLLDDTVLPENLSPNEEREACRALKGSLLRQEVYAQDGTSKQEHPYSVSERNYTIKLLQPQGENQQAVFFSHPRETLNYHYERNPTHPRIQHELVLEVDDFGNVGKSVAVGYGRQISELAADDDQKKQTQTLITYTQNSVTNSIDQDEVYRTPLPSEIKTYELTGFKLENNAIRFSVDEFIKNNFGLLNSANEIFYEQIANPNQKQKRLIEQLRTLYRSDNLNGLLPLQALEPLALPGESYKLAFTPGLLANVYQRDTENLLPNPANVLHGTGIDQGGYVDLDGNGHGWIPYGQIFYHTDPNLAAAQELAEASIHFFLPRRFRDPFQQDTQVDYDGHDLFIIKTLDPVGNSVQANSDYRVLQPRLVTDPNGNRAEVAFDALGLVVGTAVMGKEATENLGDSLVGFNTDLTQREIDAFFTDPMGLSAITLLKNATTRIVYDVMRYAREPDPAQKQPAFAAALARETHVSFPVPPDELKIQVGFSYSDGFGREIQKKIQAEPGPVFEGGPTVNPRWVGSGWTIFNNKGKPVRQYEPFFSQLSEQRHRFEYGVKVGVSPILFYDPLERVVATLHPNHTYAKVVFDPWQQTTWDVNDTLTLDPLADGDVQGFFLKPDGTSRLPDADYLPSWYALRTDPTYTIEANRRWPYPKLREAEQQAAEKAKAHEKTPTIVHFDTLGRPFLTLTHNGFKADGTPVLFATRVELDIEGNQRSVTDARDRIVMRYAYDMLGNRIHQSSMDAGQSWMLNDVTGKPIRAWDSRGHSFRNEYDSLRRPLRAFVTGIDPASPDQVLLTERLVYGEQHPENELHNLRGKLYLHLDQAGVIRNEIHDFKGNLLRASRRLANISSDYNQIIDWSSVDAILPANAAAKLDPITLETALAHLLEADTFTSHTRYDALNRPVQLIAPRSAKPGTQCNVIQPVYNEANLLEKVQVWLDQLTEPTGLLDADRVPPSPVGVNNIDYDAKGQRLRIEYKNGVTTQYRYDLETLRLVHLYTRRGMTFTEDCGGDPPHFTAPEVPPQATPCGLQNLHYTYDPAGNITHIRDDAQQTIFFRNRQVEPNAEYTYDALYRLIKAAGREHLGQVGGAPQPMSDSDRPRVGLPHPGDGFAMGRYLQQYIYDEVGNILSVRHQGSDPVQAGWKRCYQYAIDSNRLLSTGDPTDVYNPDSPCPTHYAAYSIYVEKYDYDAHGNMTSMPHLALLQWNFKDQLQEADLGGGGKAHYVYDAAGQRIRKLIVRQNGNLQKERIYLNGFELYREYNGNGSTVTLERATLHIMDDKQRIALVETLTQGNDGSPAQLIRYQFSNHLGSASLELDDKANVIAYEEYYPYGSTSYQATDQSIKAAAKRYRYTDKEKDEESGLYYHGARYYAAWLGRWISCDPAGMVDGGNRYAYVRSNPIRFNDPIGHQSHDSQDMMMGMMWQQMGREMSAMIESIFGGHAYVDPANNKVDYSGPKAGVGGVVGGVVRAGTLRAVPIEENPTAASIVGLEVGAGIVPVLDPGTRLVTGTTVTGQDTSRGWAAVQLGLDVLPFALEARAMSVESKALTLGAAETKASVSLAFKPGVPGHNMVGVNTGKGNQWSHLVYGDPPSGIEGKYAFVEVPKHGVPNPETYTIVEIPVSQEKAVKAAAIAEKQLETGNAGVGAYKQLRNDCSSYASSVLNEAGVFTPKLSTPGINYISVGLQSPLAVGPLRSASTAAITTSVVTRGTDLEEKLQRTIPEEHIISH